MAVTATETMRVRGLWRATTAGVAVLLLLVVAHDVDHLVNEERLGELTAAFWVFLPFQYGAIVGTLVLVARRHPQAPTLAAVLAAAAVLAFIGAHLVPFGPLPYGEADPLAISWALVFVPMAVALVTFAVAIRLHATGQRA